MTSPLAFLPIVASAARTGWQWLGPAILVILVVSTAVIVSIRLRSPASGALAAGLQAAALWGLGSAIWGCSVGLAVPDEWAGEVAKLLATILGAVGAVEGFWLGFWLSFSLRRRPVQRRSALAIAIECLRLALPATVLFALVPWIWWRPAAEAQAKFLGAVLLAQWLVAAMVAALAVAVSRMRLDAGPKTE